MNVCLHHMKLALEHDTVSYYNGLSLPYLRVFVHCYHASKNVCVVKLHFRLMQYARWLFHHVKLCL